MTQPSNLKPSGMTVVVAIVVLTCFAIAAVSGLVAVGPEGQSTPVITMIFAFAAPIIVSLYGLLKLEDVQRKVNGHLDKHERQLRRFAEVMSRLGSDAPLTAEQLLEIADAADRNDVEQIRRILADANGK